MSQTHPRKAEEERTLDSLLAIPTNQKPTNEQLAELARMMIRFHDFPGEPKIKDGLQVLLKRWGYTRETLFALTRQIHAQGVYDIPSKRDDWT